MTARARCVATYAIALASLPSLQGEGPRPNEVRLNGDPERVSGVRQPFVVGRLRTSGPTGSSEQRGMGG